MPDLGGVTVDFNGGVRIVVPPGSPRVTVNCSDASGEYAGFDVAFEPDPASWQVHIGAKKFFIPWKVDAVFDDGRRISHLYDCEGQPVLIDMSPGALGDTIAWFPSCVAFARRRGCDLTVCVREPYLPLFDGAYPGIKVIPPFAKAEIKAQDIYARYTVGVFPLESSCNNQKADFRRVNLQTHSDLILDVDSRNVPFRVNGDPATLKNKTVCIATRASRKSKEWNRPGGWDELVSRLKSLGFDVACIDQDSRNLPAGAIDLTGDLPLTGRASVLKSSRLFVGLPSGLSWLAHACGVPVVMINGFTDVCSPERKDRRYPEFDTPWRVPPPPGTCRDCWSLGDHRKPGFDDCVSGRGCECTKTITPDAVFDACLRALIGRRDHIREFRKIQQSWDDRS